MDLNLHLVRYLVAVVDEGHFGRAAEKLYISAPALSQQVRKLEHTLGVELIDRSAHPVHPTTAGHRFLAEARHALAAADRAVAAVEAHRRELAATLRLGFITASAGPRIRHLIDELRREVPDVSVQRVELAWPQQASAVRDGVVDAALVRPPIADTTGLRLDVVHHEPRIVALPLTHRLATREASNSQTSTANPTSPATKPIPAGCAGGPAIPAPAASPYGPSVRTMDELLETVAAGQAIAITGGFVANGYRHPEVTFVPITDVEPCPISLCTRAADTSPLVTALRTAARSLHAGGSCGTT
ncbi:LysR family transcriptional regulator [Streptomyces sp. NPDC001276]|uniref:LysR family transcriptional regulator n=1 Tax=Streptomyces sp. NPDC001276 TaxID=3364555 RepID=UPI0036CA0A2E